MRRRDELFTQVEIASTAGWQRGLPALQYGGSEHIDLGGGRLLHLGLLQGVTTRWRRAVTAGPDVIARAQSGGRGHLARRDGF